MKIIVTAEAYRKLLELERPICHIHIKKGGCFGFHSQIILQKATSTEQMNNISNSINTSALSQSELFLEQKIESQSTYIPLTDLQIYLYDTNNLDITYTLMYVNSLLKTGFEISTNTNGCCCNKSFGKKYNKQDCIG